MLKFVNHFWCPQVGERVLTPLGYLAVVVAPGERCELAYTDGPNVGEKVELSPRLISRAPIYGSALK